MDSDPPRIHPEYEGEPCPRCGVQYAYPPMRHHSADQCDWNAEYELVPRDDETGDQ